MRGGFLYDAARCTFWAPWHEGIATVDPLSGGIDSAAVRTEVGALTDAALRHHCNELHIGFTHPGWNIWPNNQAELAAPVSRLGEVLGRGSLPIDATPPRDRWNGDTARVHRLDSDRPAQSTPRGSSNVTIVSSPVDSAQLKDRLLDLAGAPGRVGDLGANPRETRLL